MLRALESLGASAHLPPEHLQRAWASELFSPRGSPRLPLPAGVEGALPVWSVEARPTCRSLWPPVCSATPACPLLL